MTRRVRRLRLAALAVLGPAGLLIAESRALACSFGCRPPVVLPALPGATVPANTPGFPFRAGLLSTPAYDPNDAAPNELVLRDATGARVPMTARPEGNMHLMTPEVPLASGPYTLEYDHCGKLVSRAIDVVDSVPFPTDSGKLRAKVSRSTIRVGTISGACFVDAESHVARLELEPSPTLGPWLSLVQWTTTVDGEPWGKDPFTIHSVCSDAGPGADFGVAPGVHHVVVTPHISGALHDPPSMEIDVALSCADAESLDAGGRGEAGSPSGADSPSEAAPAAGCSAAAATDMSSFASLGAFAGALASAFALRGRWKARKR